jgi:hypothetical protein
MVITQAYKELDPIIPLIEYVAGNVEVFNTPGSTIPNSSSNIPIEPVNVYAYNALDYRSLGISVVPGQIFSMVEVKMNLLPFNPFTATDNSPYFFDLQMRARLVNFQAHDPTSPILISNISPPIITADNIVFV